MGCAPRAAEQKEFSSGVQKQALPRVGSPAKVISMQPHKQLAAIWRPIRSHPLVSVAFVVVGLISGYDTFSSNIAQITDWHLPSLKDLLGPGLVGGLTFFLGGAG